MIAVDAPVLVELLTNGARADAAEACLRQALGSGRVVVCDSALAALCASLKNGAEALGALEEMGVHYSAVESKSALRAGEMLRRHRQRNGQSRPLADFVVGAHALLRLGGGFAVHGHGALRHQLLGLAARAVELGRHAFGQPFAGISVFFAHALLCVMRGGAP